MQVSEDLQRQVENMLMARMFQHMDVDNLKQVLSILEIGHHQKAHSIINLVAEALVDLTTHLSEPRLNYFEHKKHQQISSSVKMFVSTLVTEVIHLRATKRTQEQLRQEEIPVPNMPFYPFNEFPIRFLQEFRQSPISQPYVGSRGNSFQQMQNSMPNMFFAPQMPPPGPGFFNFYSMLQNNPGIKKIINPFMIKPMDQMPVKTENSFTAMKTQPSFPTIDGMYMEEMNQQENLQIFNPYLKELKPFSNRQNEGNMDRGPLNFQPKITKTYEIQTDLTLIRNCFQQKSKTKKLKKRISCQEKLRRLLKNKKNGYKMKKRQTKQIIEIVLNNDQGGSQVDANKNTTNNLSQINKQLFGAAIQAVQAENVDKIALGQPSKNNSEFKQNIRKGFSCSSQINVEEYPAAVENQTSHAKIEEKMIEEWLDQDFKHCVCKGFSNSGSIFQCKNCNSKFHLECLGLDLNQKNNQCPICKLRNVDPFKKVLKTVKEKYFQNINTQTFQLKILLQDFLYLYHNKEQELKKYDLQIRCLKLQSQYQKTQITWPDQIRIKINNSKLTQTYGLHVNSGVKKRKDKAISIIEAAFNDVQMTFYQRPTIIQIEPKEITLEEKAKKIINNDNIYLFGVYLIEKIAPEKVFNSIMKNDLQTYKEDYMQSLLKEGIQTSNELCVDKLVYRLDDPYTWKLMNIPVRGSNCRHAQCFDLKAHISFIWNSRNQLWRCPICSKETRKFMFDKCQDEQIFRAKIDRCYPEEVSYHGQGKFIFKVPKIERNCKNMQFESQESKESKSESENGGNKRKEYVYFRYQPMNELTQVQFTPQLYSRRPPGIKKAQPVKPSSSHKRRKRKSIF